MAVSSFPGPGGAGALSPGRRRALILTACAATVAAALVLALRIADSHGPVLPIALCRAGQSIRDLAPLSIPRAFSAWQFDGVADALVGLSALAYGLGIRARRKAGAHWPVGRTVLFVAGLAVLVVATNSAIAVYDMTLFGAHMVQHLTLVMIAPPLLVLGRPLTMLMEVRPAQRSPRFHRWIESRPVAMFFSAPVALGLYSVVIVGSHLTGIMNVVMQHPWAGQLEHLVYVAAGCHFFAVVVGNAPVRWRASFPGRMIIVMFAMVVDTGVGIVLMQSSQPIAMLAHAGWGPSPIDDTHLGGAIMWAMGDGLMALVPIGLYIAWTQQGDRPGETLGWFERARIGALLEHESPAAGAAATSVVSVASVGAGMSATSSESARGPVEAVGARDVDDDDAALDAYNRWLATLNAGPRR